MKYYSKSPMAFTASRYDGRRGNSLGSGLGEGEELLSIIISVVVIIVVVAVAVAVRCLQAVLNILALVSLTGIEPRPHYVGGLI